MWRYQPSQRWLGGVVLCGLWAVMSGCAIFTNDPLNTANVDSLLPPLTVPADAVELEVLFIERPVNDPLLGRALWNEMDQMAGIPADTRLELFENGFRVALAGSEPPPTLASLLNADRADEYEYEDLTGFWRNRRVVLRAGATTDVLCSDGGGEWDIAVSRDGVPEEHHFSDARGVLRVELAGVQDGWIQVHVTPEVHHGDQAIRREASDGQWNLASRQQIDSLTAGGFTVHLSLNEMVVLSADTSSRHKAGNHFFRREEDGRLMQRLVILRAADLTRFQVARQ